jgi:hypothetical protein
MNPSAHITDFEAVHRLHDSLAEFGADAQEALATAHSEIRRALDGVRERLAHWQRESTRCSEDVGRAKSELALRRTLVENRRTGAVEQEIALARAQQRLREAEAKIVVCRRWLVQLPEAIQEFERTARQLGGLVDADLRVSLAILQDKMAALRAYAELSAPPSSGPTGTP